MDNQEAWKRAQFGPRFAQLQQLIDYFEDHTLTVDQFSTAVKAWTKEVETKPMDPELAAKLRAEWIDTGDIAVFRKYSDLGMTYRDMGKAVNVSGSAISRWLTGTRTRRT